jgi:hypothetical protein
MRSNTIKPAITPPAMAPTFCFFWAGPPPPVFEVALGVGEFGVVGDVGVDEFGGPKMNETDESVGFYTRVQPTAASRYGG